MSKKYIIANWKMNLLAQETTELLNKITPNYSPTSGTKIVLCLPHTYISHAAELTKNSSISIGAQNCYFEKQGAFTGEISPEMIKDVGAKYVILGHSERRILFGEENTLINKKVISALNFGLMPILCVGETLEESKKQISQEILSIQIKSALNNLPENITEILIAYEPVFAIGTGQAATVDHVDNCISHIKEVTEKYLPANLSSKIRILYGGSVNPQNVKTFANVKNLDGFLIGGASLDAEQFLKIIKLFE